MSRRSRRCPAPRSQYSASAPAATKPSSSATCSDHQPHVARSSATCGLNRRGPLDGVDRLGDRPAAGRVGIELHARIGRHVDELMGGPRRVDDGLVRRQNRATEADLDDGAIRSEVLHQDPEAIGALLDAGHDGPAVHLRAVARVVRGRPGNPWSGLPCAYTRGAVVVPTLWKRHIRAVPADRRFDYTDPAVLAPALAPEGVGQRLDAAVRTIDPAEDPIVRPTLAELLDAGVLGHGLRDRAAGVVRLLRRARAG